jgi:hypothetical protein
MMYRLPLPYWLGCLLLLLGSAAPLRAQQDLSQPLPADPSRAAHASARTARRGPAATLTLPFFEDFAGQREGSPNPARWKDAKVLVNERFAAAPPSRGVATFDGLDSLGRGYGAVTSYGATDVLTSQPIDLSALTPTDSTYLSFFWQAGTIAGATNPWLPTRRIALQLEFLDNTGNWVVVWDKPARSSTNGKASHFRQRFISVNEARFHHAGFRFRFTSFGSRSGTKDSWNLDYLVLDRSRDTTSVSYGDVVLSAPLTSLLKRYTAMPAWQYNAASNPAEELNDSTFTTFNNLDTIQAPTPFSWRGVVRTLPGGSQQQFLIGNDIKNAGVKQFPLVGSLRNTPLSIPATGARVEHSIYLNLLNTANPRTAPNDTVRRITEFGNYFAYDDGTSEGTTQLRQGTNAATLRAIRFNLNRPDQVRSLRFYFAGASANSGVIVPATVTLTFMVWDQGADGLPAALPKATKTVQLPTSTAQAGFVTVDFDQVVPVSGTFFVGYSQPATNLFILFGADSNSGPRKNTYYDRDAAGPWAAAGLQSLAPIFRPVMTGNITSSHQAAANAALQVYPNPSPGVVQVRGRYTQALALDALGRTVWRQPAAQAGQAELDLRQLPAGVYLLRLTLPDGAVSTQRLVLQP